MKKERIYGYCRISTMKQSLPRQREDILRIYSNAEIREEVFTGSCISRPVFDKLIKQIKQDRAQGYPVKLVFDEVSRMARCASEGFELYKELYDLGVEIEFIKHPFANTSVYRKALETQIASTGNEIADVYIEATNKVLMILARQQIEAGFKMAQDELTINHIRTSEGVRMAQAAGKQVGRAKGQKVTTKKEIENKKIIREKCRDFGGSNSDSEVMKITGLARNTFYKYKAKVRAELNAQ